MSATLLKTEFLSKPLLKRNLHFTLVVVVVRGGLVKCTHTNTELPVTNLQWEVDRLKSAQTSAK